MKHSLFIATTLACVCCAVQATAAKTYKAPKGGKAISTELLGIFFEDISSSADGGLYAELIQNGSFEYNPTEHDGWGAGTAWRMLRPGHSLGAMYPMQAEPIHPNNPNYMRLHVERVGHYYDYRGWTGFGIQNEGHDGIVVKAGGKYDFSAFVRNIKGEAKEVRVALVEPGREPKLLGETTVKAESAVWTKVSATITATEACSRAALQILVLNVGDMDIDMVSLMPQDTYNGHGLRPDLVQALADLQPKFMRFPGGCVVHGGGDGFWNTYRWKTTVGPREQRKEQKNCWGYHQSVGLGYYEYFQLCEDLHMQPLPILACGVSCQGANGGWGMRDQAQDAIPMSEMQEWVDDALDLIEWANGDVSTKWGKVRAEAGHPEPFNLKYLGLGNEERISPEFAERFTYIYNKVRERYPEIQIVGTVGPGSHHGNWDYENGWKLADKLNIPIVDEHYYEPRDYFLNNQHNYDNYDRSRTTKVYLGEYAAKDKKIEDALYEALYLLGVERNADVVTMTSYAPLFAKKGHFNWNPDLIYFDNERVIRTCSYYVQQFFGISAGDYYYGDCVTIDEADKYQGQSVVLNTAKRELYVKLCNAADQQKTAHLDLSRFGVKSQGTIQMIQAEAHAENNFDAQPVVPTTDNIRINKKMSVELAPRSFSLLTIKL